MKVVLLPEAQEVLFRAVCRLAGVPLTDSDARRWTAAFAAMVDGAGADRATELAGYAAAGAGRALGPKHRRRTSVTASSMCRREAPLHVIAFFRGPDGEPLDLQGRCGRADQHSAADRRRRLVRDLRGTGAAPVSRCRRMLENGDEGELERFVQEVRRFYPLFPAVGGRVQKPFDWRGHHFAEGTWVILDLYGTNHDPTDHGRSRANFGPTGSATGTEAPSASSPRAAAISTTGTGAPANGSRSSS